MSTVTPSRPKGLTARELLRATHAMKEGGARMPPDSARPPARHRAAHPRARKPHNAADHLAETQPVIRVANMRSVCVPLQSRRPTCSRRSSRERS
jgi:hypothetical protein